MDKYIAMGRISDFLYRNSPSIFTGIGVTGAVMSTTSAIPATVSALRVIQEKEKLLGRKLTRFEIFKSVYKNYLPTLGFLAISALAMINANNVSASRYAAVATLYSILEKRGELYREKVVEMLGEKKEAQIRGEVDQSQIDSNPPKNIIISSDGNTLCYDSLTGRYFRSSIEKIREVQNQFNFRLLTEMYGTLNELFDDLGLPPVDIGNDLGWGIERGMLDIVFSAKISESKEPCIVLTYKVEPRKL